MKKTDDQKMNKEQSYQESVETVDNNPAVQNADTSQTDNLRAYVPVGAAMASMDAMDEEDYYGEEDLGEEDEEYFDPDEEEQDYDPPDADKESGSASIGGAVLEMAKQDLIDETVQAIRSMYRKNVDNGKMEIGELLLDKAFEGKIDLAMSTNPQKNETFAKIAERLGRLVEPKTLGSWVRAAAAMKGLKKRGVNLPNVTTYHYVELATVRDEKQRIKFAKDAELKGWSVKALREEIRKSKSTDKSEAEQLKAEMDASIRRFSDFATEADLTDFASDVESVKEAYPPSKAIELLPAVKRCLTNVRASERLLKEFHGSLSAIVKEATEPLSD